MAVDFNKLFRSMGLQRIREGRPLRVPPVFPQLVVDAILTDCWTNESKTVQVTWELRDDWIGIVEGGVTGYEAYKLERPILDHIAEGRELCVCAGTPKRWDSMSIPASSVRLLADWIRRERRGVMP